MLNIPGLIDGRASSIPTINEAMPQYIYSDKMTLKQYLQAKNAQRKLQYRIINNQNGGLSPMKQQKQYLFEKQVHDIKGFIRHIVGDGSLYNKFCAMLDNLYVMFMKQITVYHKLKVQRQQKGQEIRIKQFRQANNKLANYLKAIQDQSQKVQEKLQHIKKTKQMYKQQRENNIMQRLKKEQEEKRKYRQQVLKKMKQEYQNRFNQKQSKNPNKNSNNTQLTKTLKGMDFFKSTVKTQADLRMGTSLHKLSLVNKLSSPQQNNKLLTLNTNKLQIQQPKRNQKQQEEYNKRKQNIGKLSNVFASFIGDTGA